MDERRRFRGEHSPRFANPQLAAHYLADGADTLPTMGVMRQVERMRYAAAKRPRQTLRWPAAPSTV